MPRANRAQGRPGTGVIPKNWETDHAAVVAKTLTAQCKIWEPTGMPTINDDMSYDTAVTGDPQYAGSCRIQALINDSTRARGEEYQATSAYLVVIDFDSSPEIDRGSVIEITDSSDPSLQLDGRRLVVARSYRGSLRWERDLYCVDTVSTPS